MNIVRTSIETENIIKYQTENISELKNALEGVNQQKG